MNVTSIIQGRMEERYVAMWRPTDDEVMSIANAIVRTAEELFSKDRRGFTSIDAIAGMQIGIANRYYQLNNTQYDALVGIVMGYLNATRD